MTQTILITGASAGIGAEFARQYHQLGFNLILVARRADLLQKMTSEFNSQRANSANFFAVDLSTDNTQFQNLLEMIKNTQIDILINNVGRGSFGYFDSLSIADEIQMVNTNIIAPLKITHAVIPQMKARKSGSIINLASIVAFQALPFMTNYAATKAFNFTHSLGLRHELAKFGIKVLAVCPGPTSTEFGGVARVPGQLTGGPRDQVQDVVKQSIQALEKNKAYVVTCWRSKLLAFFSRNLPTQLSAWIGYRILLPAVHFQNKK